ncbi:MULTISPECIES: winged helix-turn-helix transcriptional regulator [Roseibium]|uniref:winged helix-turn-helix transcriptional regulator n=1 Tax=Roseibium TaxID=150830 RepID=UPI001A8C1ABA|nr:MULTISPECIES: helix-turn-helix domain-containing protein [Roseibium]MBN8181723.1 helix-turn-helix transcriptional regulator [Roseibium aggregatum]MBO6856039.1 helix-turn-helix transcriptional regulator [Roseibium sp.]MEC9418810.1 helix-turn-helix domain-containing protein [Pseudomonadota bacterium]UES43592.1 transcriptional regulator [Roseibium aggregatum]
MSEPIASLWRLPGTQDCPVADTLKSIGGKHTPRVLHCLTARDHHFLELQRTLKPISRKVLTQELRHLEEIGLVARTELDDAHRRVRYALTPKGRSLTEILGQVYLWAVEHHGSDAASAA